MLHANKKIEGNMNVIEREMHNIQIKLQEMKNICEMKNRLHGINSWLDTTEGRDRAIETNKNEVWREKDWKENEQSVVGTGGNSKQVISVFHFSFPRDLGGKIISWKWS